MTDFLVTGIGASAGGVQALKGFFEAAPADSGIAYVIILHLSPDHDSQLAQILQQVTSMPVAQVTDKIQIEPDHIYVIPPDRHLTMEDGYIVVSANTLFEERRAPVDIFFRSLAESHGGKAVAVILSGTGANGSMGLKHIKEKGGAVFVQNPREAEFNEMPRNSIATDLVDDVLNVAEIPVRIVAYRNSLKAVVIPAETRGGDEAQQQALRQIFTQLRMRTGHDFSNYKRATLMRRIERRISIRVLPGLLEYVAYINEHPEETHALLKDLLISVTNFFRDKKPFEELNTSVLPQLFDSRNAEDQVRIWVAGCATGEEAYTMAILCAERTLGMMDAPKVQIFATDIDESAITVAREGYYTLNDAADISPERLSRFFTKEGEGYRVRREIRETILFAHHNFLKDPPFSRLDLISCRNVLIYLNRPAQERVMETFHFALKPMGFMMLGTSESVDNANDLFKSYSREQHIYQSRQITSLRPMIVPESVPQLRLEPSLPSVKRELKTFSGERADYADIHLQVLEQYAPPSLIVNADFDIVHLSSRAGRYLQMVAGEPTQSVLKIISEELRSELRNGLYQALQKDIPVNSVPLKVRTLEGTEDIRIHVRPITNVEDQSPKFLLVVFEPATGESEYGAVASTTDESATRHLEDEVTRLRTLLRASNDQHEFQAEELKAGNEELQAMNEELRSATEELETSKEELQSINEELSTVNQELKVKVEEASMISSNLQNLINSTDIGTIFLDRSFRVVLFTPATRSIFNLIPADYGRPITDITHHLQDNSLLADAEIVLDKLQLLEREAATTDGRTFLVRLSPYRTEEDRIQGVVISFVDITDRKRAEVAAHKSEERQNFLVRLNDILRPLTNTRSIKAEASRILGIELGADRTFYAEVLEGSDHLIVVDEDFYSAPLSSIQGRHNMDDFGQNAAKILRDGYPVIYSDVAALDFLYPSEKTAYKQLSIAAQVKVPLIKASRLVAFLGVHQAEPYTWTEHEITLIRETAERTWLAIERAKAEEALAQSEEKYRTLFESIDEGFCTVEILFNEQKEPFDYRFLQTNPAFLRQTGLKNAEGKTIRSLAPDHEAFWFETYAQIAITGDAIRFEHEAKAFGRFYDVYAFRIGEAGENKVAILFNDIITRKRTEESLRKREEQLRISEERYRIALQSAQMAAWDWDVAANNIIWNDQHYFILGLQPDSNKIDVAFFMRFVHPEDKGLIEAALQEAIISSGIYKEEFRIICADSGQTRWMNGFGRAVTSGKDGQATRMVGVMYDITARKSVEQQKEEFIGIASHELQTPLTAIYSYAQILEDMAQENTPEERNILRKLNHQLDRMGLLVKDLLDVTRLNGGTFLLRKQTININETIKDTVDMLQRTTTHHITLDLCPDNPTISADQERIKQVLYNLISNAVKYSPEATEVIVRSKVKDDDIVISVKDFGIGMDEQTVARIFERFYRGVAVTSGSYTGLGLGLYITGEIVRLHDGTIWAKSMTGNGSVFYFSLPQA